MYRAIIIKERTQEIISTQHYRVTYRLDRDGEKLERNPALPNPSHHPFRINTLRPVDTTGDDADDDEDDLATNQQSFISPSFLPYKTLNAATTRHFCNNVVVKRKQQRQKFIRFNTNTCILHNTTRPSMNSSASFIPHLVHSQSLLFMQIFSPAV